MWYMHTADPFNMSLHRKKTKQCMSLLCNYFVNIKNNKKLRHSRQFACIKKLKLAYNSSHSDGCLVRKVKHVIHTNTADNQLNILDLFNVSAVSFNAAFQIPHDWTLSTSVQEPWPTSSFAQSPSLKYSALTQISFWWRHLRAKVRTESRT